ncbi:MAG: choice-of-anchor J domain-containing protein, partial [Prevotella sp.]|nr:choice-of-anchor J domain-containing protein [Prevotella sp.]
MKIRNLLLFGSLTAFLVGGNIDLSAQTSDNERQAKAFDRTVKRVGNRNDFRLNAQLTSISKQQNAVHKYAKKEQGDNIYFEDFANEAGFGNFVVVNSNEDDKTWELATGEQKTCARYNTHATNFADDWLITPKITLPGGRMYTLTFKAASRGPFYPEALEVKWGTGQTVADMKNTLLTKTEIKTERNQWTEFEYNIKATEDMDIYVGFHAVSNPNSFTLYVTDITVDNGRDLNAPDKVTDFTVIPDMAGAAKATVKFKTPTK